MSLIKCPECGQSISDKSTVCIHCGFPLNNENNTAKKVKVIVHRRKRYMGCAIGYAICVDDSQVGTVRNGKTCEFYVNPGTHNFTIGKGKNGSIFCGVSDTTQQIDVKPGLDLYIECSLRFWGEVCIESFVQK